MERIVVHCDGLCEPINPGGVATYGWVARRGGENLREECAVVTRGPEATNNVAEYAAVIAALEWLLAAGFADEDVEVRSDSQLCINQLTGRYAVRSSRIAPLYQYASTLARCFRRLSFRWVPREQNAEADALSRRAYTAEIEASRARRAAGLSVRRIRDGLYAVGSASRPGVEYVVRLDPPSCECPDHHRRGVRCKHILAAEAAEKGEDQGLLRSRSEADVRVGNVC